MLVFLGSLNVDRLAWVRRFPQPGETVPLLALERQAGGKGGNGAAQAARLGAHARLVARVGDDEDGRYLLAVQRQAGVDTEGVQAVAGTPTGTALIWVDEAGESRIGVWAGANATLTAQDVEEELRRLAGGDVAALVANLEVPLEAVEVAVRWAHAQGVPVLLNLSPLAPFPLRHLSRDDVLVVNGPEAQGLLGHAQPAQDLDQALEVARRLAQEGPGTAVVTLGAHGSAAAGAGGEVVAPAPLVQAVDATGAGDAYLGALAVAWEQRWSLSQAMALATACAAYAVTRPGAMAAQGGWEEVKAFAQLHGLNLGPGPGRSP